MLMIYWFYKVLRSIKSNNIEQVKLLVEKHFKTTHTIRFLKYSACYSYDCFIYFYTRYREQYNMYCDYTGSFLTKKMPEDINIQELGKVFHYDFIKGLTNYNTNKERTIEIMGLQNEIIGKLSEIKRFDVIEYLMSHTLLSKKEKDQIFMHCFVYYYNESHIKKMIEIFNIEIDFVEMYVQYHARIIREKQYRFIIENYGFTTNQANQIFMITSDHYIIENLLNNYDIKYKNKLQKMADVSSLYIEKDDFYPTRKIFDVKFYRKVGLLDEENIINSYKTKTPIFIHYYYLPLLDLSEQAIKQVLKMNLRYIIDYCDTVIINFDYDKRKKMIEMELDNYFYFIKDKINLAQDNHFIQEEIQRNAVKPQDIELYFYKKFPDLFMKKAHSVFTRIFNYNYVDAEDENILLKEILNESNIVKKVTLVNQIMESMIHNIYNQELNKVYYLIKFHVTNEIKQKALFKLASQNEALPVLKDILAQEIFNTEENIHQLFINSIGMNVKNALYFLKHYKIETTYLVKGFMNICYCNNFLSYQNSEHNILKNHQDLLHKILENNIQLTREEQEIIKGQNINIYKLYQSYALNHKLNEKLEVKGVKVKKLKI